MGHRPDRLEHADLKALHRLLRTLLQDIADEVKKVGAEFPDLFANITPRLRAVSPLAEGVDRIFAEAALDLGFELCCVMPFFQEELEKDFVGGTALESGSLERFRSILTRAGRETQLTCFQLDGSRADEGAAYRTAGRVVINQSDILILVWDGRRQDKRGGTEETIDEVRQRGIPVIWVDAQRPHGWQLVDVATRFPEALSGARLSPVPSETEASVRAAVRQALVIPQPLVKKRGSSPAHPPAVAPRKALLDFYAERRPRWSGGIVWTLFRSAVADWKLPKIGIKMVPFETAVEKEWPRGGTASTPTLVDRLRPFYAWPDQLALIYSNRYRGAFISAFVLAALAVGMALLPMALRLAPHTAAETAFIASELVVILLILGIVLRGKDQRWHERWLEYRLAAELVRTLRVMATLGGAGPFPQVPAHWASFGQPAGTWMAWYVRAVERDLGLPSAATTPAYITSVLEDLHDLLRGQVSFHSNSVRRCHNIDHRLHVVGSVLIGLTLAACGLHLAPTVLHTFALDWTPGLLTACSGFFPALGAAVAGIANQGEFRRIARQSAATKDQLAGLAREVAGDREQAGTANAIPRRRFTEASKWSAEAARLLIYEVLDWRTVILDRPLEPPG